MREKKTMLTMAVHVQIYPDCLCLCLELEGIGIREHRHMYKRGIRRDTTAQIRPNQKMSKLKFSKKGLESLDLVCGSQQQ